MGGWVHNPSYHDVCQKMTGHAEVVEVTYDTTKTRFPQLLKAFFSFHDATRDRTTKGGQYRSVIFYTKAKEQIIAQRAIEVLKEHGIQVTTLVKPALIFWEAEKRHQGYVDRTGHYSDKVPDPNLESLTLEEAASISRTPDDFRRVEL